MEQWLDSIYSDGSRFYVSNPHPLINDEVTVSIRIYDDAPVKYVFLRSLHNGAEDLVKMEIFKNQNGYSYYKANLKITENRISYQFYVATENQIYYYTQRGVTDYVQDNSTDFVLLADYVQPEWVKESVFYQIFPERFCNGNPLNDVKDGEYELNGHKTIHVKEWEEEPKGWQKTHGLDFYGGDLEGIRQKLPYLKELGVTALYINPIFESPSTHKYDCSDYFHVDKHFGGDQALADLTEAAHDIGIKVILDISINHTGITNKWTSEKRDYYFYDEEKEKFYGWAGYDSLPTLDYRNEELIRRVITADDSVLKKWLKPPYNIDGWRFDVADVFARKDEVQLAHKLWPMIRNAIREVNPDAYILAEDWGDCNQYLQGQEWDSPMNYFGCARPLREFLGQADLFVGRSPELKSIKHEVSAESVKMRVIQHLSRMPYALWENQFNLLNSHDISRLHNDESICEGDIRGAIINQFMFIGTPSVYYGDELSIDGHTGDDTGCRFPMPWSREKHKSDIYFFYKKLCDLKRNYEPLKSGGMRFIHAEGKVLSLARFTDSEGIVSVFNAGSEPVRVKLELGLTGLVDYEKTDIFGNDMDMRKISERMAEIMLPPHTAYIFKSSAG